MTLFPQNHSGLYAREGNHQITKIAHVLDFWHGVIYGHMLFFSKTVAKELGLYSLCSVCNESNIRPVYG